MGGHAKGGAIWQPSYSAKTARRIAANIAKLPALLKTGVKPS
jgi:hypothetical protein